MIVAQDGEQAMSLLSHETPNVDIVLLDLNMPKRGGNEVLEILQGRAVPVIVLTSSDSPSDRMNALRMGATRFIRKPTGLDDFLAIGATIKQLVQDSRGQNA